MLTSESDQAPVEYKDDPVLEELITNSDVTGSLIQSEQSLAFAFDPNKQDRSISQFSQQRQPDESS